jgi:enoyl-CoA hydratase/carnithine racemase
MRRYATSQLRRPRLSMNEKICVNARVEGGVGILELNRPEKFNCLSLESHQKMLDAVTRWRAGDEVRSILVCSTGKHFCTGADLDCVRSASASTEGLARYIALGHRACRSLEECGLPTVVAVQGMCLAGGLELMLSCDVAFCSADAQFGDQHAVYGLVPGWGGSQRLTRVIGRRRAMDLFYTGKRIDASVAQQWGLVNHVSSAENLRGDAFAYCKSLDSRSSVGLSTMKRLAYDGLDLPLVAGLALEEGVALRALTSEDAVEGLDAFGSRRKPDFPSNRSASGRRSRSQA